ncbi:YSC84-related protein [Mameliella sediminis]|uniref:lipid-binding SYLF domain-containing protein n=1 Tax=Mameliella sediminis TaxID=2836866 RepID=UPI001C45EEA2|nr:YSC84-related protein [Mameliella sediminis]MBY6114389.1 twin-arginine translocation pathway signal [Antarctobacter heliothermus]MBY6143962.1 twin-arginine translocation pathway signal [Mameliella alba]MBV7393130.1 twin-arginine translocation pathway signal [Mameliella sediminis]MBY6163398.1 twin-arginine translocation pathway signal [Mameliella alba]MBY6171661.1 twin-arginine translocation pathway signal [Mameliella alba]
MTLNRRNVTLGLGATLALGACNGVGSNGGARIDARVDQTLARLYGDYPATRSLAEKSVGMLVMPVVTEAGLGFGGGYGRGALRVGGASVDYYSVAKASGGLQIGAQQYSHVLFFMTDDALQTFRRSPGFAAGANLEYAVLERGETLAAETTTSLAPVIAVIFGQAGLRVGATLEGVKYTRIIP